MSALLRRAVTRHARHAASENVVLGLSHALYLEYYIHRDRCERVATMWEGEGTLFDFYARHSLAPCFVRQRAADQDITVRSQGGRSILMAHTSIVRMVPVARDYSSASASSPPAASADVWPMSLRSGGFPTIVVAQPPRRLFLHSVSLQTVAGRWLIRRQQISALRFIEAGSVSINCPGAVMGARRHILSSQVFVETFQRPRTD